MRLASLSVIPRLELVSFRSPELPSPVTLRVLVVGDDALARAGLASLLERETSTMVTTESNLDDLEQALLADRPDAVAWDFGGDATGALERLRRLEADLPPIVAPVPGEEEAVDAIAVGARGVLLRNAEPAHVTAAIRAVTSGVLAIDDTLAGVLVRRRAAEPLPVETLTRRELQVLDLLAQGLPNKLIADRLGISEHTAKFHVNSILAKLGAESRTEAVVRAARLGLIAI